MKVQSHHSEIYFEEHGEGDTVVLIHPFPLDHHFWDGVLPTLAESYRVIALDLRGHGASPIGNQSPTMSVYVDDLLAVLSDCGVERAHFVAESIGGYILFELWRRERGRVRSLSLCCTKATADSEETRANRLRNIAHVREFGTEKIFDAMARQHLSARTVERHPEIFRRARELMDSMSVEAFAQIQRGMMERPNSTETLRSIDVPVLVVGGADDPIVPYDELATMHRSIAQSRLEIVPDAGHYAPMERPEIVGPTLRRFLDDQIR